MKIDQKTRRAILDEIRCPEYQEGDLITTEVAEELGISYMTALRRLNKKVEEGKLTRVRGMLPNRSLGWLFRVVETD